MDFIQLSKLSKIHDGKNIIFCKTDFVNEELEHIETLGNDVVLITANSDHPITDTHISKAPKNLKKWYAQNALANSEILEPIPIGIENKTESLRPNHGIGYFERVLEKERLLNRVSNITPSKFIYSNFNVSTNFKQRIEYKNLSLEINHIDWEENKLTLEDFFNKILEYKMVLCPVGNGVDTHRLWEVLYSNRIPITVKVGDFKIYDLYKKLPIIILDSIDQLRDYKFLEDQYNIVKNKKFDLEILETSYWIEKIKKEIL
jgi:hypothetical protein